MGSPARSAGDSPQAAGPATRTGPQNGNTASGSCGQRLLNLWAAPRTRPVSQVNAKREDLSSAGRSFRQATETGVDRAVDVGPPSPPRVTQSYFLAAPTASRQGLGGCRPVSGKERRLPETCSDETSAAIARPPAEGGRGAPGARARRHRRPGPLAERRWQPARSIAGTLTVTVTWSRCVSSGLRSGNGRSSRTPADPLFGDGRRCLGTLPPVSAPGRLRRPGAGFPPKAR
jgi:hypothetical protein